MGWRVGRRRRRRRRKHGIFFACDYFFSCMGTKLRHMSAFADFTMYVYFLNADWRISHRLCNLSGNNMVFLFSMVSSIVSRDDGINSINPRVLDFIDFTLLASAPLRYY
jgi:hypothetical protein